MDNYTLWVDEFGHFPNTLGHAPRKPNKATRPHDMKEQYFTLLGVAINNEAHGHIVHRSLENLKKNHFPKWADNGVILHRYDIENFKGPFNALKKDKEKARSFYNAISAFLQEQRYYNGSYN